MLMNIDPVVTVDAAGPARGTCAIMPAQKGPRDVTPAMVASMFMGEGRTVRLLFSTAEARAFAEMLMVCACVAEGGMPPVAEPARPSVIINGGRA